MEAAAKGAVTLDRPSDKSWTVTDTQGPQGWAGLDSVTQRVARLTGGPGLAFTASEKDVDAGREAQERAVRVRVGDPLLGQGGRDDAERRARLPRRALRRSAAASWRSRSRAPTCSTWASSR